MSHAATLVVRELQFGVRPVRLRLPFRFGAVTLQACPQLFARVVIEVEGGLQAHGSAAEMLVPKWFDKRKHRSHADNVDDLLGSVQRAAQAYRSDKPASAFGLFARHYLPLMTAGQTEGATELSSAYGQAVIDRAVLDALCRARSVSFFDAVVANLIGMSDSAVAADMHGFVWDRWLAARQPRRSVQARHTIGMLDELHASRIGDDGLPVSLPAVIDRYGIEVFKIKLGGDVGTDAQRLAEVLTVLDQHAPGHRYSLDGNEQYRDASALDSLFAHLRALPAFAQRPEALLYIEQPLPREASLQSPVASDAAPAPLLMDEADGTLDAFVRGARLGWQGVSSKACKGLYKSIVNRARCDVWNATAVRDGQPPSYFMSAEDLTCQAGLSVQQDLALLSLLGLTHTERNGHHYADGFGDAPAGEQQAFAAAHSDLYEVASGRPRLRITGGRINLDSIFAPGYARSAEVDWSAMQPLSAATTLL